LTGNFSPTIPPFANRGFSRLSTWIASGDKRGNENGVKHNKPRYAAGGFPPAPQKRRRRNGSVTRSNILQQLISIHNKLFLASAGNQKEMGQTLNAMCAIQVIHFYAMLLDTCTLMMMMMMISCEQKYAGILKVTI
jgi:hypothetical protein